MDWLVPVVFINFNLLFWCDSGSGLNIVVIKLLNLHKITYILMNMLKKKKYVTD